MFTLKDAELTQLMNAIDPHTLKASLLTPGRQQQQRVRSHDGSLAALSFSEDFEAYIGQTHLLRPTGHALKGDSLATTAVDHDTKQLDSKRDNSVHGKVEEADATTPRQRVLVIGGAGYIGSALVPKLLDSQYAVRVLDMFLYGAHALDSVRCHRHLELIQGDCRDVGAVLAAMQSVDAVIHLAGIAGDKACDTNRRVAQELNVQATQMAAQLARASEVERFIFASSCGVYGTRNDIVDEGSETHPETLYGLTKSAVERGLQRMARQADVPFCPTILRLGTLYGWSGRRRVDLLVNHLVARARFSQGNKIAIPKKSGVQPFVHVRDVVESMLLVLKAPLSIVANQVFNVGTDEEHYSLSDVGQLICEYVHGATVREISCGHDVCGGRRVRFDKIRTHLNFEATFALGVGIERILEEMADGDKMLFRDVFSHNRKFYRSYQLSHSMWSNQ